MIIEPCCCHRQLSPLLKENESNLTVFHTNGDVTIEKLYHAVGRLVGNGSRTIITPTIDTNILHYLRHCFDMGWLTNLNILTAEDQSALVSSVIPDNYAPRITVLHDSRITESSSLIINEGTEKRLAITGYFPTQSPADTDNRYRLVTHTALLCDNISPSTPNGAPSLRGRAGERLEGRGEAWKALTYIPLSPFRIHSR